MPISTASTAIPPLAALIRRSLLNALEKTDPRSALVLTGPRHSGKTALLQQLVGDAGCRWVRGGSDAAELRLSTASEAKQVLSSAAAFVIDDAHKAPNIAQLLKVLGDAQRSMKKPCRIYIASSAPLDLKALPQPAEGEAPRVLAKTVWPFSLHDLAARITWRTVGGFMERFLVYGTLPMACLEPEEAESYLKDYCENVLLRDFFELNPLRRPNEVRTLLKLLARSTGDVVSYDRLGRDLNVSRNTVEDYVKRLEAHSVIRVCPSFSRRVGSEMKKGKKIYFFDNGVRNALIGDFSPIKERSDGEALWENFFFMERVKLHDALGDGRRIYFWRTTGPITRTLGFVEAEAEGLDGIEAFDCSLNPALESSPDAKYFLSRYRNARVTAASPQNVEALFRSAYVVKDDDACDLGRLLRGG